MLAASVADRLCIVSTPHAAMGTKLTKEEVNDITDKFRRLSCQVTPAVDVSPHDTPVPTSPNCHIPVTPPAPNSSAPANTTPPAPHLVDPATTVLTPVKTKFGKAMGWIQNLSQSKFDKILFKESGGRIGYKRHRD